MTMDLENFEEQVFFSTVRITIPHKSGVGTSIGTGFLHKVPLGDTKGRAVILLISNKHVYVNPQNRIVLHFTKHQTGNPAKPDLGNLHVLEGDDFGGVYTEHPDPQVDLACLNISVIGNPDLQLFYRNTSPEMLANYTEKRIYPGMDVWFVGYPENRYDTANNLPIMRKGHIASVPKVDFNGRKQIIIDAQVFPGSSGSPVFGIIEDKYKMLGVVTETMIRHEQLQAVPVGQALAVQQVLGLGIILKSVLVQELVEVAVEKVRKALAEKEPEPVVTAGSSDVQA